MLKTLMIDFLYLDLHTCERCVATDGTLEEALEALSGVLDALNYEVKVNKVEIATRELAKQYRFVSSPTIRVNGFDIGGEIQENNCCSCGTICGDTVDCRTFTYDGASYEQPPKAMLIDGILRVLYGNPMPEQTHYALPDNLARFFAGLEQATSTNNRKEGHVMKAMQIFEPAMCCSTGLCGVSIDPELLRISTVLDTLKKQSVTIERFNLSSAPMEFVNNQTVNSFINQFGADKLPVTVLDGTIIISGRYPSNEEFCKWLELPSDMLESQSVRAKGVKKTSGCGCSGGNCCKPR